MKRMPVVFVGHGSPMNAVEENTFTRCWKDIADSIPRPKAILMVSAHWVTNGLKINGDAQPKMLYDMYGFPDPLYEVVYNAPGAPELAQRVIQLLNCEVAVDKSRGFDHGNWSVLSKMYPDHDIPLTQLSVDLSRSPEEIYQIGHELQALRDEGVLIIGSGNVVHNLRWVDWDATEGYAWADSFDKMVRDHILKKQHLSLINYAEKGEIARLSVPTVEHYLPLLYILGATTMEDEVRVYNDARTMGSLSMTSYVWE
jgi:4,5-DOPA dioxygenase extradiol